MLSIGTFSKISKVTTKTLRYYDEVGLLKPAHVNGENGYRFYDVSQLRTILMISKLKLYSFSLEEIAEVLKNPDDEERLFSLARQKRQNIRELQKFYQDILRQLNEDIGNLERGIHIMAYLDEIPVKLVETQTQNILFIRKNMSVNDTSRYIGQLFEKIEKEKLTLAGEPMTIFHHSGEEFNPESYDNEVAIPVLEAVKGTRELAGGLCAMVALKGAYTGLPSVYARLRQWCETEGYTGDSEAYECYVSDPFKVAPEDNVTEIYLPVRK